jgi:hypothetical protein
MLTAASSQTLPNYQIHRFPSVSEIQSESNLNGVLQSPERLSLDVESQIVPQLVVTSTKVSKKTLPNYLLTHCAIAIFASVTLAATGKLSSSVLSAYLAGTIATSGCLVFELQRRQFGCINS